MPLIPDTWEVEARGSQVQGQTNKVNQILSLKKPNTNKRAGGVACLSRSPWVQFLVLPKKRKKRKKGKGRERKGRSGKGRKST
jgi:hypothetical protein